MMDTRSELTALATKVLEPNLQFYRQGPDDKSRYMVGPEVLQALSWVATSIAIPILIAGANEIIKEKVKDWLRAIKNRKKPRWEPPNSLQNESKTIIDGGIKPHITQEQIAEAVHLVSDYLRYRGWPAAFATADATEIVELIHRRVGASE